LRPPERRELQTRPPRPTSCENRHHREQDAPVRHCPDWGALVNAALVAVPCDKETHARVRRWHVRFCVDCGTEPAPYEALEDTKRRLAREARMRTR
jgi:hypothetical protein